jgi:hypothetical protein
MGLLIYSYKTMAESVLFPFQRAEDARKVRP